MPITTRPPITASPLHPQAPSGILVFVVEDAGAGVTLTRTRSVPWDVCGTTVVLLTGRTGGFAIERCFEATEALDALLED